MEEKIKKSEQDHYDLVKLTVEMETKYEEIERRLE